MDMMPLFLYKKELLEEDEIYISGALGIEG